jgi:hypothetical protein
MAKLRQTAKSRLEPFFSISPKAHMARLLESQRAFDQLIQSFKAVSSLQPRRNTASTKSRYIAYMRDMMEKNNSLWMMPLPPSLKEQRLLEAAGFKSTLDLAKLKFGSSEFFQLCIKTGISPDRMRVYMARSMAKKEKKVIFKNLASFIPNNKSERSIIKTVSKYKEK